MEKHRTMEKHWMWAVITVLAMALFAGSAFADRGDGPKGPRGRGQHRMRRRGMMRHRFGKALDLTEEQQAKVAELRKAAFEKVKAAEKPEAKREILKQLRADLQKLLTDEQKKKAEELCKKHGLGLTEEQRGKIAEIRKNAREEVQKLLTDEQRKKIEELHKKARGRMRERRGRRHGGRRHGPQPE